ncbi:MAG: hypothetical protein QGH88_06515 [Nitrosopumilus sp.]|jgi:hypothetical protein|nr:hypothetical protein [Nitrosopumilus sp.]
MKKIFDKIVTGFFVITLGMLWYCSTRYYIKPNNYSIIIYDVYGNQVKIKDIRTEFKTSKVAKSYIAEYKKRLPHYDFTIAIDSPNIKNNTIPRIFKISHK